MRAATAVFGSAREAALAVAIAVGNGYWDRVAALRVETWVTARGFRGPRLWASWARYHLSGREPCPMLPVLRRGRQLQGDVDAWIEATRSAHCS